MQTPTRLSWQVLDILLPFAAGLLALVIYGITMAPDLSWANFGSDGGELITASITSGVAHPPGYPTYVLLGQLFGRIPVGTIAWRFNLLSAVSAATAVAFLTAAARNLLAGAQYRDIAALSTGLAAAFAPLLWSQALIAEVYTLNLALLSLFLWSIFSKRSAMLSGVSLGLAITVHLSSLLMLPLAIALIPRHQWKSLALGALIGLTPLLLLPLLAQSGSPVVWGDPATPAGWWWLVSGRLYHANIWLPQPPIALAKTIYLAGEVLRQLAFIGLFFVVLGISTRLLARRAVIALLVTALLYLVYSFLYQTDDAVVQLLPITILLSPLLAAGLSRIGSWSLLLPALLLVLNFQALNLRGDATVRQLGEGIFSSAPDNAILLTAGDQSIFSLWYFQHVEGSRPDLILVDANLLAFDWYRRRLGSMYPDLAGLEKDDVEAFRATNSRIRPFCDVAPALTGLHGCQPGQQSPQGQANGG